MYIGCFDTRADWHLLTVLVSLTEEGYFHSLFPCKGAYRELVLKVGVENFGPLRLKKSSEPALSRSNSLRLRVFKIESWGCDFFLHISLVLFCCYWQCCGQSLSRVWLFVTLWTVAHQVPLSTGFSRQEYWSVLPCPSPGDLLDPGMDLHLYVSYIAGIFFTHWATWDLFISVLSIMKNFLLWVTDLFTCI